jgi:hypothetical protein
MKRGLKVIVRRDRPVVGRFNAESVSRIRGIGGRQEAALALHGRIGRGEIRQVRQRNAKELQLGVLEVKHLVELVVDDAHPLDLPQRRLLRIVLARRASRVDAVLEHRVVAAGAIGAGCRHAGSIGGIDAQRIDEAVAVVVAQIQDIGIGDLAVHVGHADVAFGMQPLGLLIVDDLVRLDAGAVVEQLHVADSRYPRVVVVVIHLIGLHQHLPVVRRTLRDRLGRSRVIGEALRESAWGGCQIKGNRQQQAECSGKDCFPDADHAHALAARSATPAKRSQS